MTGLEPPPEPDEDKRKAHGKPIFARSCRSAQSGCPTAPREVHLPLLPHGPSGVHRHLPRRTRLRRSAGPEENRSVPIICWNASILLLRRTDVNHFYWPYSPSFPIPVGAGVADERGGDACVARCAIEIYPQKP